MSVAGSFERLQNSREVGRLSATVKKVNYFWEKCRPLSDEQLREKTADLRRLVGRELERLEAKHAGEKKRLEAKANGKRNGRLLSDGLKKKTEERLRLLEKKHEKEKRELVKRVLDAVLPAAFAIAAEASDRRLGQWNVLWLEEGKFAGAGEKLKGMLNEAKEKLKSPSYASESDILLSGEFYREVRDFEVAAALNAGREELAKLEHWKRNTINEAKAIIFLAQERGGLEGGVGWKQVLPLEYYNAVREVNFFGLTMRPFDEQLMAGVALHEGKVVEMKTGEGKTLAAVMPAFLNALTGLGVHIATANEYLAKRDFALVGEVFRSLGMSVGITLSAENERKERDGKEKEEKEGEIVLVDPFTGRLMQGRRFTDGLHQALEAKEENEGEKVSVREENEVAATITLPNYYRGYSKLAGMTGTAMGEREEFARVYGLEAVQVPTHRRMRRKDMECVLFPSEKAKWKAVVREVKAAHACGRPVLVGTSSIEKSEKLSMLLLKAGIGHEVLNARPENAEREAKIVELAGQRGAVTVATNMAGRGTDIKLGQGVAELGGLYVIGTEMHEAGRIDWQLRGRAGRQGDPGSSVFLVSAEDEMIRRFGKKEADRLLKSEGMPERGMAGRRVSKVLNAIQKRIEANDAAARRSALEFDNVVGKQRDEVYMQRERAMEGGARGELEEMAEKIVDSLIAKNIRPAELCARLSSSFPGYAASEDGLSRHWSENLERYGDRSSLKASVKEGVSRTLAEAEKRLGRRAVEDICRIALLQVIDEEWVAHLTELEAVKDGIWWRAYGGEKPLNAFIKEAGMRYKIMVEDSREKAVARAFAAVRMAADGKGGAEPATGGAADEIAQDAPLLLFGETGAKHISYRCDITYGTNSEFGFDHLRDNIEHERHLAVQRGHNFAIVDEADSILIDEAKTPHILSGKGRGSPQLHREVDAVVKGLIEKQAEAESRGGGKGQFFEIDGKERVASLTEKGAEELERQLGVKNIADLGSAMLHALAQNALLARLVFQKGKDYVVDYGAASRPAAK